MADELRRLRKEHGLSQSALARLMGVTTSTVARWEQGVRAIPDGYVRLAFEVLELRRELGRNT